MSSFFERIAKSVLIRLVKEGLGRIFGLNRKRRKDSPQKSDDKLKQKSVPESDVVKIHQWRLCPIGEHWVQTHPLTVPPSSHGPEKKTVRRAHCRKNSGRAEFYTADELKEMADQYFDEVLDHPEMMPIPDALGYPNGNKYDRLIGGWTKYWNEVLEAKNPLSSDFVKTLIATESSFNLPEDVRSKIGPARGLIQITESTRKILQDPKGELRDHLIEMSVEESREPEINIAAGIRWLHHKKRLAESRLKREVTWEEAGAEFKGILPDLEKDKTSKEIMKKLKSLHQRLEDQRVRGS